MILNLVENTFSLHEDEIVALALAPTPTPKPSAGSLALVGRDR